MQRRYLVVSIFGLCAVSYAKNCTLALRNFLSVLLVLVLCSSCYHRQVNKSDALVQLNERQIDSLSFFSEHHYTNNFNFVVSRDSVVLYQQQPEEILSTDVGIDSFVVARHCMIAVADIRIMPADTIDSVWVQLATEDSRFGWSRESRFLPYVVPDDPISQFISIFSDVHLIIFLVVIVVIVVSYWIRHLLRHKAPIVHFRDINSFYPTLLALLVATSATFYAYLQTFCPEMWRHFYYHPTLNPFGLPIELSVFLVLVWSMLIVALAAADDVRHQLPFSDALLYLSGLMAVCAANYIVFSITSLYYVGYFLLVAYICYAVHRHVCHNRMPYRCGKCGAAMHHKGKCPKCGTVNE